MNSAQKLRDLAAIGHAAYGQFSDPAGLIRNLALLNNLNGGGKGFATDHASRFSNRFHVAIPTYNDATALDGGGTGFDVTVFRGVQSDNSNQISVSIRGTQQPTFLQSTRAVDCAACRGRAEGWKGVTTSIATWPAAYSAFASPYRQAAFARKVKSQ